MVEVSESGRSESVQDGQETQGSGKGKRNTDPNRLVDPNINNLKDTEPEFYQAMLNGMAMELCNKMKHWEERIKKARKEYEKR